jgi:uncharacterized protein (DUF885 family)
MRNKARLAVLLLVQAVHGTCVAADDLGPQRAELRQRLEQIGENPAKLDPAEQLKRLNDVLFDCFLLEYPEEATYLGRTEWQDRWSDDSAAAIAWRQGIARKALEVIRSIDPESLRSPDRLNHGLLHRRLDDQVRGQRFPSEWLAISNMAGPQYSVPMTLAIMPTATIEQYENILARLERIPEKIDQTITLLTQGLDKKVTLPRIVLEPIPEQVLNLVPADERKSALLVAFTNFPATIPDAAREQLRSRAQIVFRDHAAPAYRKLHAFLVDTYLPGARTTIAARALPDGEAWYAHDTRRHTTTDLTPREIHELGLSEVKRIRKEMDAVIAEARFEGTFADFLEFLRTDPKFFFESPSALLRAYRDTGKRIDPELVKLFGRLPRTPYGVKPVPSYSEKSSPTAYYEPGAPDGSRAGFFFANTYDLKSRPVWEMEALTLHEAVPGHHLQISLAMELEELPWYRRFGAYTAFIEGWGLYAESLGADLGLYRDPYSKFGRLTYEMWRAIRLVVDTGMHDQGWSRDQAIAYFKENAGKAEHDIVVEVDRYIGWPGQALAYKVGELKIQALRAHARRELGSAFEIRRFHDHVLGGGPLPLDVLETRIREWVAAEKARASSEGPRQPSPASHPFGHFN